MPLIHYQQKVRSRFANDPGEFLAFVQDDNNYDEMVKLGLAKPKAVTEDKIKSGKNESTDLKTSSEGLNKA